MDNSNFAYDTKSTTDILNKEKQYWLDKLSNISQKSYFPYGFSGKRHGGNGMKKQEFHFSHQIESQLLRVSNNSDNNIFIILLACLKVLIYKYTSLSDTLIIVPIYRQKENRHFVNTSLILRDIISGKDKFKSILLQVRNTLKEANENLNYPINKLIYNLDIPSDTEGFPLSDIAVYYEQLHLKDYILHLKPNIIFSFRREKELTGTVEFNAQLYDEGSIGQITSHFTTLLSKVLTNIDSVIDDTCILTENERSKLLYSFNPEPVSQAYDKSVLDLFQNQLADNPLKTALVYNGQKISYSELDSRSGLIAAFLQQKGVVKDTIVALYLEPGMDMVVGILGVMKAGAVYLPIDTGTPTNRLIYILKDSCAKLLLKSGICDDLDIDTFDINDPELDTGIQKQTFHGHAGHAYMIYTSGTTGKPKGVLVSHRSLFNYINWFSGFARITQSDKTVLNSSYAFDLGYTILFSSLSNGAELHLLDKETYLNPDLYLNYIEENQISYIKVTPSYFNLLINHGHHFEQKLRYLRSIIFGGEKLIVNDIEKLFDSCPIQEVINHYGPTETTIGTIAKVISRHDFPEYSKVPTIGSPINNTKVYLLDKSMNLVPVGTKGNLFISGLGVSSGYINDSTQTAEKYIENPFLSGETLYNTGDIACWTDNGEIVFIGRDDNQVKLRGYRIELSEIEGCMVEHPYIQRALSMIKKNQNNDEVLCVYYESDTDILPREIKDHLRNSLPEYMIPSVFVKLSNFPLTRNGKVDFAALPDVANSDVESYIAPRNEVEKKLVKIWAGIFGVKPELVSTSSDFFEAGGNSLNAVLFISKIHKELHVNVPLVDFVSHSKITELAVYLSKKETTDFIGLKKTEKKEYYPLSKIQERLYFLWCSNKTSTVYNIPIILKLEGRPDLQKLHYAFNKLVERHESLRTSFRLIDYIPYQIVHDKLTFDLDMFDLDERTEQEIVKDFITSFSLDNAPLLRVGLIKLSANESLLVIDMHHIIKDGYSNIIMVRDFMAFYNDEIVPPVKFQFNDYIEWQNRCNKNKDITPQKAYWLNEFKEKITEIDLLNDFERSDNLLYEGASLNYQLSEDKTTKLYSIAKQENTTIFMVLFAVYNILLSKISGKDDIIVGTPIAGRNHADLENIIGMFVNTLAIRSYPMASKNFVSYIHETEQKILTAIDNIDYPYEDLIKELKVDKIIGKNPLFDTMFVLNNINIPELKLENIKVRPYHELENSTAKFDITLTIVEGKELSVYFNYNKRLFKKETILMYSSYFNQIVDLIAENRNVLIKDINIASFMNSKKKDIDYFEFNF